ncbi:MAG TPA: histidine kinase dimerization/phospho-acceptor domain-containing protein [Roseiarcus sp.]|nr:histidine kinase dimerization/phospho-acceptor domain-containing protein [Roseiarcus sp.]
MRLPPSKLFADWALAPEWAEALDAAACRLGGAPIAIIDEGGRAVGITPSGLALFGASDRADFEKRFLSGPGPLARRLRWLAATLPVADPPRLERVRRFDGTRATAMNVRCARIAAGAAAFLVLSADDRDSALEVPDSAPARAPVAASELAGRRSRFLFSLDKDGRFGAPDPALTAALGTTAPKAGETIETASRRASIEDVEALIDCVGRRDTFSGLRVVWQTGDGAHALPIALSGAPLFDNVRAFAGFRGFGTIGAPLVAPHARADPPAELEAATDETRAVRAAAEPSLAVGSEEKPGKAEDIVAEAAPIPPSLPAPHDPVAPKERTAEIVVLRQGQPQPPATSKVVPIRPGAFDASRPAESDASDDGAVELSKAEREAFREIARALVGRAAPSREDAAAAPPERPSDPPRPPAEASPAAPAPDAEAEGPWPEADDAAIPVLRNALTLLDRLPIGVLVARDAQPLYLNLTLLTLLGYRDLEHFESSEGLTAMFRGDDRPTLPDADDSAFSIYAADGRARAVEGRAQVIVWDGAPATLMMLRPAKRAARAEARPGQGPTEAEEIAAVLDEMLSFATDGAAILDSAGRIQTFNASAARLFGYPEAEVAGESVLMLLAPPSHPAATARLDNLSRLGEVAPADAPVAVIGRDRDGGPLELALTLARVGPPDASHYCALFRDMRREREQERRLAAARDAALAGSAAKTDFLAHVSHEIRTPLHAILGFAEVMMEERFGPIGNERYRDYLRDIHTSGRHVMSLADDLLDLSKIESGKLELAFTAVDANSLIRECVSLMQPQAAREKIIMRVSLYDRLPRVMVDERSLRQIMLNLMSNAVKFNEPGGQVIVSTAVDAAGQAVIRVRDTGVGMNESEVGLALEPFGQVGHGGAKGGVGLGLPLTKALIEANKAEFSIKSRRDHGTLVEISFPVVQAAQ